MNQVCLSKTSNLHKQDKYAGHIKALIMNLFQMKRLLIVFSTFFRIDQCYGSNRCYSSKIIILLRRSLIKAMRIFKIQRRI
jgi:hypothetical protein